MAERMLVTKALDERDFLKKKIISTINSTQFVASKRKKDEKIAGKYPVEDFKSEALQNYQSITDMIKRYKAIDAAITLSNAVTNIEVAGETMTMAAAIGLRKSIVDGNGDTDFTGKLISVMNRQFQSVSMNISELNLTADRSTESMKTSMFGRDSKNITVEDLEVINKATENLYGELVDPISIESKIRELADSHNTLVKDIEVAIKISNATTYVEF